MVNPKLLIFSSHHVVFKEARLINNISTWNAVCVISGRHLMVSENTNPSQRAVQRGSLLVQPKASKRGLVGKSNLFRPRNLQFQVIIWPWMVLHRHLVRGAAEQCACLGDTETDNFPGFSNEWINYFSWLYICKWVCWRPVISIKRESYRGKLVDIYQWTWWNHVLFTWRRQFRLQFTQRFLNQKLQKVHH